MQNPYEVLGIKEGATKEEIKAAYREQVKKYHPDRHQDNPLYELAEEKLQEINEAYETLTKDGGNRTYRSGTAGPGQTQDLRQVRVYIDKGNLGAAEAELNRSSIRNAEWFYLSGILSMRKGWYDDAINNIQTACSMEPANYEYRNAMNSMMQTSQGYRTTANNRGYSNSNDELCRMLQCYCCADALCDCM
ncbi:MAG: DnaJ domain-containing protein [Eubacteriales bacterium]|nr:DnaJ domain-containing protein [Eubacteriales bacterium]MDD3349302.1 DnaJ domain-containing protein [Eubacteriales bacterium]